MKTYTIVYDPTAGWIASTADVGSGVRVTHFGRTPNSALKNLVKSERVHAEMLQSMREAKP